MSQFGVFCNYINETIDINSLVFLLGRFSMSMKTPDEILVQKVLEGDKSSFGILVERYKRSVFKKSLKTTRNFHDAQDLTQDVFAEAYLNLQSLREPAKFGSWLQGITQNLCLMWLRKKRILSDLEIPLDNLQTEVVEQWLEQEKSENWEFGTELVNNLSDDQKSLLKLFYLDNRSCREIAQQMGASEVAIRQRLRRTRQQLKNDLLEGEKDMNRMIAISAICAFLWGSATLVWPGTFRDNFNDGDLDGWEQINTADLFPQLKPSKQYVENGELVIEVVNGASAIQIGDVTWKDYEIEVDAKIIKNQPIDGEGVYIAVRSKWPNAPGAYHFSLGTCLNEKCVSALYIVANDPGNARGFKSNPWDWELDKWYRLKLVAEGEHFKFYIDEKLAMEYVDGTHEADKVAIGVSWEATTARFDNVVITGSDVSDMNLSVTSKSKLPTTWGHIKSR